MAIVKHIKSRNANYADAINYLLFEHDEKTGKKIVDESGRSILPMLRKMVLPEKEHRQSVWSLQNRCLRDTRH